MDAKLGSVSLWGKKSLQNLKIKLLKPALKLSLHIRPESHFRELHVTKSLGSSRVQ
jgi:hypothetical protein